MALWDSADLLRRCRLHARRPPNDQAMPNETWYAFLGEAQPEVVQEIAARKPDMLYPAPILMTTSDGGYTYGFGLDAASDPIFPMGHLEVYENLRSVPDDPLVPGDDFIIEGTKIRIPYNRPRTFSAGPYARFVVAPDAEISATSQPIVWPKPARILLVWKALEAWAARPGSGASPDYYTAKYEDALNRLLLQFATEYNMQAAQGGGHTSRWWSTGDLLRTGQFNG